MQPGAAHHPHPLPGLLQMKELQLVLSEANESLRGLQEQLSQERQLRKDEVDNFSQKICQVSRQQPRSLGDTCPHGHATSSPRLTTCLGTQGSPRTTHSTSHLQGVQGLSTFLHAGLPPMAMP